MGSRFILFCANIPMTRAITECKTTWKLFPGYPGYEVSTDGSVRRCNGKALKTRGKRPRVTVSGPFGAESLLVDHIVAKTYLDTPWHGVFVVEHLDGDDSHCAVSNLVVVELDPDASDAWWVTAQAVHGRNRRAPGSWLPLETVHEIRRRFLELPGKKNDRVDQIKCEYKGVEAYIAKRGKWDSISVDQWVIYDILRGIMYPHRELKDIFQPLWLSERRQAEIAASKRRHSEESVRRGNR